MSKAPASASETPRLWGDVDWNLPDATLRAIVDRMVSAGVDPGGDDHMHDPLGRVGGWTPIWRATYHGAAATTERLIAAGADIHRRHGVGGGTGNLIAVAVGNGHMGMLRVLVAAGLDPVDAGGSTPPFHAAAERSAVEHASCMEPLVMALMVPADVRDEHGRTVLHRSVSADAMRTAVRLGCPVDAPDARGQTPFAHAIALAQRMSSCMEASVSLLDLGASLRLPPPSGLFTAGLPALLQEHADDRMAMVGRCMAMRDGRRIRKARPWTPAIRAWASEGAAAAASEPWGMRMLAEMGASS